MIINSDNSERLENEYKKLITEEINKLKSVVDAMPYGVLIATRDNLILHVNKTGLSVMGFSSAEELMMMPLVDLFFCPPSDSPEQILPDGKTTREECVLKRKSGDEIPVLKTSSPCKIGDEEAGLTTFIDISDRKRGLADLSETRRQFATLLGNLPGMVYRCRNDRDWTMEFLSDGCFELTGYRPEDIVFNRVLSYNNLIIKEDQERIWNEVQEKMKLRKPFTLEYRIHSADGKTKWVWEKANGIFSDSGTLQHIEGFISDVTENRHAGLLQQVVFEISTSSYTAQNLDELFHAIHKNLGRIIDVENFYVAIYDRQHDTISLPYQVDSKDKFASFPVGKTITGYVIKTGKPLLAAKPIIEELAAAGHIQIIGSPSQVWLGVPLIVDTEVTGVLAVQSYTDPEQYTIREMELLTFVADQIATSISRRSAEDSFQREKAYLDQLFEGSPEAIILINNNGIVLKVNSEFSKLFGYGREEMIGQNIDDMIADPDNKSEAVRITAELIGGAGVEIETKRRHKDGRLVDVSLLVTPIVVQEKIFGGYGIYRDITYRKQTEKNLIASKEKAEGADKLKSAFLSNMSHEIRTPMNAILGFSTLLSDPGLTDEERSEFIQIIKDRGNDLMRIIDDIIDISKIESGQINFEIKDCPVNILMTNLMVTLNELKRRNNKTKVSLNCFPGNLTPEFTIMTDGNRLRQIMTNLIENALKFTEEGHVDFGYALNYNVPAPFIEFFVRDTGIGIPKEMHNVVFERFRQVDDTATRKYGGTGLGLTISRNLTRLLGGEIWLESDKGKGTTFYMRLPLSTSKSAVIKPTSPKPSVTSAQKWQNKALLIVEDEESNYFLLDRILRNTGIKMVWAKNGIEAVDLCEKQHFDAILMDIRMPIMDGYETTQAIRKKHKDLVIIAQTAYALKGEREKSIAAGCNNYIAKPIDTSELLTIMGKYLNTITT